MTNWMKDSILARTITHKTMAVRGGMECGWVYDECTGREHPGWADVLGNVYWEGMGEYHRITNTDDHLTFTWDEDMDQNEVVDVLAWISGDRG